MMSSKYAGLAVRVLSCWVCALASGTILSACTILSDGGRKQCSNETDCVALNDELPTRCVSGLCVASENGECRRTSACAEGELCDTSSLACVANPACSADNQCAKYDASPALICVDRTCTESECTSDGECAYLGADGRCDTGRCVDLSWQCLGEPVVRNGAEDENDAELRLKVLYAPSDGDKPLAALSVRVCVPADVGCTTPVTATSSYDGESGWLTVGGLRDGSRYVLELRGENPSGGEALLEGDYALSIPVLGRTEIPQPIYMFTASTRAALAGAAMTPLDAERTGLVFARVVDCAGRSVEGVSMSADASLTCGDVAPGCQTTRFYLDAANIPHTEFSATDRAGFAGLVNAVPDVDNLLAFQRVEDDAPYASLLLRPSAGRVTYTTVFPGEY